MLLRAIKRWPSDVGPTQINVWPFFQWTIFLSFQSPTPAILWWNARTSTTDRGSYATSLTGQSTDKVQKKFILFFCVTRLQIQIFFLGTAKFTPQNINPYLCTHLIYAFGGLTKDDTIQPFDKYQDIEKGKFWRNWIDLQIYQTIFLLTYYWRA